MKKEKLKLKKVNFLILDDVSKLTKRVLKMQAYLKKIEKKRRRYKRKQKKLIKKLKKSHRRTYWLITFEIFCIILTNIFQVIYIKNKIISKQI